MNNLQYVISLCTACTSPQNKSEKGFDLGRILALIFFELSYSIKLLTAKNLSIKILVSLVFSEVPGSE